MCKKTMITDDVTFSDVIFGPNMTDVRTAPSSSRRESITTLRFAASAPSLAEVHVRRGMRRRSPTYYSRYVAGVRRASLTSLSAEEIMKNPPAPVPRFELTRYKALPAINSTSKDDRDQREMSASFSEETLDQIHPNQPMKSTKSLCNVVIAEDSFSAVRISPKNRTPLKLEGPTANARSSFQQGPGNRGPADPSGFLETKDSEWKSLQRRKTFAIIEPLPHLERPTVQQDDDDIVEYNLE